MELSSACKIGFRAKAAAELDQRLAVVVAMAVEGAIDPTLNAALERIEDGQRVTTMASTRPHSRTASGMALCTQTEIRAIDAKVAAHDQPSGQRVGHAALEDQVGVHQPVADDGPTEGERQKDQRKPGQIGQQVRRMQLEADRGWRKRA